MQIIVQGLLTHYQHSGQGKTILLLHGWANSLDSFETLKAELITSYDVISVDLPGFGKTQTPKSAWNLDDYSQFVKDFLDKLNIPKIYCVVGHSNGGALAIRALSTKQISAQKLVLLASSGVRNSKGIKNIAIKAVAKSGKVATFWLSPSTKQKLQQKLYGTIGSDMLVAPHMKETFKLTVRQDIQADARKLDLPTLLIYGNKDKATPLKGVGEPLHRQIANSRLEIVDGADHFAHQTNPEQIQKLIMEFLS